MARGAVRVSTVSLSGKQVTLTYVEPGIWFGDIALFDGLPRTHDANAHGETTLLVVRKADFKELLAQHVELYDALLRLNCRRLRLMFDLVEDLNTPPAGGAAGQADPAAGESYGVAQGERDPHRPAAGAGRPGAAARRIAPARQPGAQGLRARRRGAHRADAAGGAVARASCWRSPSAEGPAHDANPWTHFTGTQAVAGAPRVRRRRARAPPASAQLPGFAGPLTVEQFKGGQSNPTYKLVTPQRDLCDAHQARPGGQAAAVGARDRARVPRHARAGRQRRAGAADAPAVRGRSGHRPRLLRDGVRRRAACCGTSRCPASTPAGRGAIYDEMNRVIAALHSVDVARSWAWPTTASRATTSSARSARWSKQYQASITAADRRDGPPDRVAAGAHAAERARRVAGGDRARRLPARQPDLPPQRAAHRSPCSTGSCRRSAIRWPTSATTAWRWHIPPGVFRGIGGLDLAALGIPSEREYVRRYCERTGRGDPDAVMADWNFYLAYNLFRLAGDPARHRQARRRRHRRQRAGAHVGRRRRGRWPSWAGGSPSAAERTARPSTHPHTRGAHHGLRLLPAHAGAAGAS